MGLRPLPGVNVHKKRILAQHNQPGSLHPRPYQHLRPGRGLPPRLIRPPNHGNLYEHFSRHVPLHLDRLGPSLATQQALETQHPCRFPGQHLYGLCIFNVVN